jgi:hypothetical protein
MDGRKGAGKPRELCACGKPVWSGGRSAHAPGRCVTCAEKLIRADTIRRLTRSGAMAAMRRALEVCPNADRMVAVPLRELSAAEELAHSLVVGMANAETDVCENGEYVLQPMRSKDTVITPPFTPWNVMATGLKYTDKH